MPKATELAIEPIAPALGALIHGVDLSQNLPDGLFPAIHTAFLRYGVLFFHDQTLTPKQQLAFARRFGPIHFHPHVGGLPDLPEVMEVLKTEKDQLNFGGGWHTDNMFLPEPALATLLLACELPDVGGDTLFACMRGAYQSLSPGMRQMVRRLKTVNLPDASRRRGASTGAYAGFDGMNTSRNENAEREMVHPLVRTHPETGEDMLYVGLHTERFANFTDDESQPLLAFLLEHATRDENRLRFRWQPGTLAVWDNRQVLHNALNDYPSKRRRMHRVSTVGDKPFLR